MDGNNLDVTNIVFKTQKKLLSTFVNRKTIGPVLDEDGKRLIDSTYHLFKEVMGKKDAQKLTSRLIKMLVKLSFLVRNDHLNREEMETFGQLQSMFSTVIKTIISFWTISYSFECEFLQLKIQDIESQIGMIVCRHMTDKNKLKLSSIFQTIRQQQFLTDLFNCDKSSKTGLVMHEFITNLESLATTNRL